MKKEIYIVHGLPGSGKTTYLKQFQTTLKNEWNHYGDPTLMICNIDNKPGKNIFRAVTEELNKQRSMDDHDAYVAFDGLFSSDDMKTIVLACADYFVKRYELDKRDEKLRLYVNILHWNEDREQCIINDKQRGRSQLCTKTIETMPFENDADKVVCNLEYHFEGPVYISAKEHKDVLKHDINDILRIVKFYFDNEIHDVPRTDEFYALSTACDKNGILKSERWCVGGKIGNCWNNDMDAADADETPKYFRELVEVLQKIDENFKMTDYLYILDNFVKIKETTEHEYYGSYYDYNWYECNIGDVINYLKNKN